MPYLVIDTETSGLPDYKLPADDPSQPRLAHLAMIGLDDAGAETFRQDIYVKPDGWRMEAQATEINGLTDEFLMEHGVPVRAVLEAYSDEILSGNVVVAFNAQFDCKIMRGELRRAGMPDLFEETKNSCVMRPMVTLCGLKQGNTNRPRWPKLIEALAYFGHTHTEAHKAMSDAEGAAILFRELRSRGLLQDPRVHYAKNKPEGTPSRAKKEKTGLTQVTTGSFPDSF